MHIIETHAIRVHIIKHIPELLHFLPMHSPPYGRCPRRRSPAKLPQTPEMTPETPPEIVELPPLEEPTWEARGTGEGHRSKKKLCKTLSDITWSDYVRKFLTYCLLSAV